jgi:MFS family permease
VSAIISPEHRTKPLSQNTSSEAQSKKHINRYAMYVFFVLFAATFLNGLDASEFAGASAVIGRELHLGINEIGMLASAFTIFLTISIIPVGIWADRAKRSHVIGACLAVWSLATVLTGLASNFVTLFLTRMFTGVGEAGYAPAGNAMVGDFFQDDQRGKVMSWLSVGGLLGPILGMVLGGMIAGLAPGSWRFAFLITGIPGLILAFFAWRLREPVRRQTGALSHEARTTTTYEAWKPGAIMAQLRTLLRIKTFACLLIFGVLTSFTATALQIYFPILLQQSDTFGLTSAQAAAFAGLALGPTALVGIVLGGYLADWLKKRYQGARILICALSVLFTIPLNVTSLLLTGTHNLALFSAFLIPAFFINMLHIGPLGAAMLDVIPTDQRASALSISVFIQRILGTALAPLLIGMLASGFDPSGLHFLHNLAGHDIVLALLCTCPLASILAGVVCILGLRWIHHD